MALTSLSLAWTLLLVSTGGFRVDLAGLRISSRNPTASLTVALIGGGVLLALLLVESLRHRVAERAGDALAPSIQRTPRSAGRFLRGTVVVIAAVAYFAFVFRLHEGVAFAFGLDDWLDPYFINFLQEHWLVSVTRLSDPVSPPMFFPVRGTLGYSHGLVLYAPFYVTARLFLDTFPANTAALFLVMVAGSISLYACLRSVARLAFFEALSLSAFFFSSANVINVGTSKWSQRASVFLIPPVVLLVTRTIRMADTPRRTVAAVGVGLLSTLLFTQDAYTAYFAGLLSVLIGLPAILSPAGRDARAWIARISRTPLGRGYALGAYLGILVFVWCYLGSYRQHAGFPEDHLFKQLVARDPASWHTPLDFLRDLRLYDSYRTFVLAIALAGIVWAPGSGPPASIRRLAVWFLGVSAIVVVVPFRYGDFSPWQTLFAAWPGLGAIRDPRRLVYLYELAAVAIAAWFLMRLAPMSPKRWLVVGCVSVLLIADWNSRTFLYARPVSAFDRWVRAPIQVDPSCRSFFITGASADYMKRAEHMWSLYNVDAMFIALQLSLPTLNGYSAWTPEGWDLANPQQAGYLEAVDYWIERHDLRNVCALDIDRRTMTPYVPTKGPGRP